MEANPSSKKLRNFNHFLSVVVLVLSLYIILIPLLPKISYWLDDLLNKKPPYLVLANQDNGQQTNNSEEIPKNNTLVIPSIKLQQEILEGTSTYTLDKGIWHRPNTSSPDLGGNTVIAGHRFAYTRPDGPFYHLDKVRVGDKIVVYWNQKKYIYKVDTISVTKPDDVTVEQNTDIPVLTLYTCTPIWSAKDRLVIRALLEGNTQ